MGRLQPWWLIEENFMEEFILEDLGEFQGFWVVLEERRKKEEFWTLRKIFKFWQIRPLVINWAFS